VTDHGAPDVAPTTADLADLAGGTGPGPADGVHWALGQPSDLNANLVRLGPSGEIGEHTNREVDVVVVTVAGGGRLRIDDEDIDLRPQVLVHVPKGARRRIEAGPHGLAYLTVHRRRGLLTIGPRRGTGEAARAGDEEGGDPACWAHLFDLP